MEKICVYFLKGTCWRGNACSFKHPSDFTDNKERKQEDRSRNWDRSKEDRRREDNRSELRSNHKNKKRTSDEDTRRKHEGWNSRRSIEKRSANTEYRREERSTRNTERDIDVRRKRKTDNQTQNSNECQTGNKQKTDYTEPEVKKSKIESRKEKTHSDVNRKKPGSIFCICGIQTYENGMLICTECKRYSHAECYKTNDLSVTHICGGCATKTGVKCNNLEIQTYLSNTQQNQEIKSKFVFDLAIRRVLNSILREEYKLTQPGNEPSEEFLKLKFGISSSYANKILVHLFKSGFISEADGIKVNVDKIRKFTRTHYDDSGFLDESINKETEELEFALGENIRSLSTTDNNNPEEKIEEENKGKTILVDSTQPSTSGYIRKFIWPENFINRESRKDDEPIEPLEPKDIGKTSSRPFFGQVLESLGPRLNSSEQKGWNLCFKLGRKGESIQVWAFGSETEIKNLNKSIIIDSYLVYWGNYVISPKTSKNLNPTSDWIIKIPTKTSCMGKVSIVMSKIEEKVEEDRSTKESFSAKFQQPSKTAAAKKRRKEKSFEEKQTVQLDADQLKITDFLKPDEDVSLILHNESSDNLDKEPTPTGSESKEKTSNSPMTPSSYTVSPRGSTPSPYYSPSPDRYVADLSLSISSDSEF